MASGRILVHASIADAMIERLVAKATHLPVGDPMSGQVALGPLINARQVQRVHAIVHDSVAAGATLLAGGSYDGLFYQPTVLTGVRPGMRCFEEELFGPVASITVFDTDEEAMALANATERRPGRGRDLADRWRAPWPSATALPAGHAPHQRPDRAGRGACAVRRRAAPRATAAATAARPTGTSSPNGSGSRSRPKRRATRSDTSHYDRRSRINPAITIRRPHEAT